MSTILAQEQKFCRFEYKNQIHYGIIEGNNVVILSSEPWNNFTKDNNHIPLEQVNLLNPTEPRTIIGLIKSYKQNWEDKNPPKTVRWFVKTPNAAWVPGKDIFLPSSLDEVKVEVELVIVIGKKIKNASEEEAKESIFGYTIGCDLGGNQTSFHKLNNEPPDIDENPLGFALKSCDGFEPFGPFIYKNFDWKNRKTILQIIDEKGNFLTNYENNTSNLLYTPEKIVSDLSKVITLSQGDIISTGTGKSFIAKSGNTFKIFIEGLGGFETKIR